jgi:hypothetical protein
LVADAVGFKDFVNKYFSVTYLLGLAFLENALDDSFGKGVWHYYFQLGAGNVGGFVSYPPVYFLSGMLKSHPLHFVKGQEFYPQLGNTSVDLVKS